MSAGCLWAEDDFKVLVVGAVEHLAVVRWVQIRVWAAIVLAHDALAAEAGGVAMLGWVDHHGRVETRAARVALAISPTVAVVWSWRDDTDVVPGLAIVRARELGHYKKHKRELASC